MEDDDDLPLGGEEDTTDLPVEGEEVEEEQVEGDEPVEQEEIDAPVQEPVHRKLTASERIQQEIGRRKALEAELERARRTPAAPAYVPPPPDPAIEQQRLMEMDPLQQAQYLADKVRKDLSTEVASMKLQMQIDQDKMAFQRTLSENPTYSKYADKVEQEFQNCLYRGQPRTRDELLGLALWQDVKTSGPKALAKAQKTGQANIARQTTRPTTTRSGVPSQPSKTTKSAEQTLFERLSSGAYN